MRGRVTAYRVRAQKPPPQKIWRIIYDKEVITLTVEKQEHRSDKKQEETKECTTWAEVAKQALGRNNMEVDKPYTEPEEPTQEQIDQLFEDVNADTQHEDDMDDSWVEDKYEDWFEENPAKKAKVRPSYADPRVDRLESQLDVIQQQLSTLMKTMQGGSSQRVEAPRAMKGQIPLDHSLLSQALQVHQVPGDGACLWHTMCALASSEEGLPRSVQEGQHFKTECCRH